MSLLSPKCRILVLINAQHLIRKYWVYYKLTQSVTRRRHLRWTKNLNWEQSSVKRRIGLIYLYLWERRYSNIHRTPCVITDPRGPRVKGCSWYNVYTDTWCKPDNKIHMACYET